MAQPKVLLLKGTLGEDDDDSKYHEAFTQMGMVCRSIPILVARAVNVELLQRKIADCIYGGLILTSKRATLALKLCEVAQIEIPVYVVGESTAAACRQIGLEKNIRLAEEGQNAGDLADFIAVDYKPFLRKPLLFLVGDKRLDELPQRLNQLHIDMDELLVYETKTREDLQQAFQNEWSLNGPFDWLCFFSPSGVNAVKSFSPNSVFLACIGRTTAAAVQNTGLIVHAIAEKPTAPALAKAIHNQIESMRIH